MAKIGLKYIVYKTPTKSGLVGKGIQADINIESNDSKLYADDGIAEIDKSFRGGTITLGVDDLSDEVQTDLLGHAVEDGEITGNENDEAVPCGIGIIAVKKVSGARKYRAVWLTRVQFGEPSDSNATKGESIAFGTPTMQGEIIRDDNGNWKQEKTFASETDARNYLNGKADLPVSESNGLTALSLTGTGGTLSPAFGAGVRYYTFAGVTAASVTVTVTAAGHAIDLLVNGVKAQTLVSGTASAAITVAAGSKKLTIVAREPNKTAQTTEIVVTKI